MGSADERAVDGQEPATAVDAADIPALLEERKLLLTLTVQNNPTDTPVAGEIDLRQAVASADTAASPSTINFSLGTAPVTITLSNGLLDLSNATSAITIDGPGASLLSISGNNASGVFQVDSGVTASLSGLTITAARSRRTAAGSTTTAVR